MFVICRWVCMIIMYECLFRCVHGLVGAGVWVSMCGREWFCMCAWMCVCVSVCICKDIRMYISRCKYIVCMYVHTCICIYVSVHVCVCVHVCKSIFKCTCVLECLVACYSITDSFVRFELVTWDTNPIRIHVRCGPDILAIRRLTHRMIQRFVPVRAVKTRRRLGSKIASFMWVFFYWSISISVFLPYCFMRMYISSWR